MADNNSVLGQDPISRPDLSKFVKKDANGNEYLEFNKETKDSNRFDFPINVSTPASHEKMVRRLGENYPAIGVDLNEELAAQQSAAERWAYFVPRAAAKAAMEAAKLPGIVEAFVEWGKQGFTAESMRDSFNNGWLAMVGALDEEIKEKLPIYTPKSVANGNLWENLGSSAFWANEGADGVGFLIGMLAPGQLVRALSVGTKVSKFVSPMSKLAKPGLAAQASRKLAGQIDNWTAATLNTGYEASVEALETYDSYIKQFPDDVEGASKAATAVFRGNAAILLGPNILAQKWLFNGFKAAKLASASASAGKGTAAQALKGVIKPTGEIVDQLPRISKLKNAWDVAKHPLVGIFWEGFFEEGLQYTISEAAKAAAERGERYDPIADIDETVGAYLGNLLGDNKTDFWKSVVLGSILGGGMASIGGIKQDKQIKKLQSEYHKLLKNNYLSYVSKVNDVIKTTTDENGNEVPVFVNGEYQVDPTKVAAGAIIDLNKTMIKELASLYQMLGNEEGFEAIMDQIHFDYMLSYLTVEGGIEVLKQHINHLAETEAKSIDTQNGGKTETTTKYIEEIKKKLLDKAERYREIVEDIYDTHDINFNLKYDKKNSDLFKHFSSTVMNNKLSHKNNLEFFKTRVEKLRKDLSDISKNKISSSTDNIDQQLLDDLNNSYQESLKTDQYDKQQKLTIDRVLANLKEYTERYKESLDELTDLYDLEKQQKDYDQYEKEQLELRKQSEQGAANQEKENESKGFSSAKLEKLFKDHIEDENLMLEGGTKTMSIRHRGYIRVNFEGTSPDGNSITGSKIFQVGNKNNAGNLNLREVLNLKENSLNSTTDFLNGDDTITIGTVDYTDKDNNKKQLRGGIFKVTSVETVRTAAEAKTSNQERAIKKNYENALSFYREHIDTLTSQIKENTETISNLKESLKKIVKEHKNNLLTEKGTERKFYVGSKKEKNTVVRIYKTKTEIEREIKKLDNNQKKLRERVRELRDRRNQVTEDFKTLKIEPGEYLNSLNTLIDSYQKEEVFAEERINISQKAIEEITKYLVHIHRLLKGYNTSIGKALGIDLSDKALGIEFLTEEEKSIVITNVIQDRIEQLVERKFKGNFMDFLDSLPAETIDPLLAGRENAERILDGKLRDLAGFEAAEDNYQQILDESRKQHLLKRRQRDLFLKVYERIVEPRNVDIESLVGKDVEATISPEKMFENMRQSIDDRLGAWEFSPKHPFDMALGWKSFLYSQSNQEDAATNDDVARLFVFINNFAHLRNPKNLKHSRYSFKTMTYDQVGSEKKFVKDKVKFHVGGGVLMTYEQIQAVKASDNKKGIELENTARSDIKLIVKEGNLYLMTDKYGNPFVDKKNKKEILYTSLPDATEKTIGGHDRFTFKKVKLQIVEKLKADPATKDLVGEELIQRINSEVDVIMAKAIEDYKVFRSQLSKDPLILDISSVSPGKKVETREETDVEKAINKNISDVSFFIESIKSEDEVSTDGKDLKMSVRYVSGVHHPVFNGFLYMYHNNRLETVKPKTLGETESVNDIINLFRYVVDKKNPDREAVYSFLKEALYHNKGDDKHRLLIIKKVDETGEPILNEFDRVVFGQDTISIEDLIAGRNLDAFKAFLSNKYWNFDKNALENSTKQDYISYKVDSKGKLSAVIWPAKEGGYKSFLFNDTTQSSKKGRNPSKGTVQLSPAPKSKEGSSFLLAKNPQYINQSVKLRMRGDEALSGEAETIPEISQTGFKEVAEPDVSRSKKTTESKTTEATEGVTLKSPSIVKVEIVFEKTNNPAQSKTMVAYVAFDGENILHNVIADQKNKDFPELEGEAIGLWYGVKHVDEAVTSVLRERHPAEGKSVSFDIPGAQITLIGHKVNAVEKTTTEVKPAQSKKVDIPESKAVPVPGSNKTEIPSAAKTGITEQQEIDAMWEYWGGLTEKMKELNRKYYGKTGETQEEIEQLAAEAAWRLQKQARDKVNNRFARIEKDYSLEDLANTMAWFKQKFPNLPIEIVKGLIEGKAFGRLTHAGKVLISDIAEEGTIYHEAFHVWSQFFLTDAERTKLYNEKRKELGIAELTDNQIEEILAEDFRDYMLQNRKYKFSPKESAKKNFFERIWDAIKSIFNQLLGINIEEETSAIELAFRNIDQNTFSIGDVVNKPTSDFNRIKGLSTKETLQAIKNINYHFFKVVTGDIESGIDTIFNIEQSAPMIYEIIKTMVYEDSLKLSDIPAYQIPIYEKILSNWDELVQKHALFLTQYKVDIREELDEDDKVSRNTQDHIESNKVSIKELLPDGIKILIGSLPSYEDKVSGREAVLKLSDYGMLMTVEFNKSINILQRHLSKSVSLTHMLEKLEKLAVKKPEFSNLIKKLGYSTDIVDGKYVFDISNLNNVQFRLLTQLYTSFSNNRNNPRIANTKNDGTITYAEPLSKTDSEVIKNRWVNKGIAMARSKSSDYISYNDGVYLLNIDKLKKDIISMEAAYGAAKFPIANRILNHLGIEITDNNADISNYDEVFAYFKYLRLEVDSLKASGKQVFELNELYDSRVFENQKELNKLLAQSADNIENDVDLMYFNQEGNMEYSITKESHLSEIVNRLNHFVETGEIHPSILQIMPFNGTVGSLFSTNSKYIQLAQAGNKLELDVIRGTTTEDGKGLDITETTHHDYKKTIVDSVLRGAVPLMRAGNRGMEYTLSMGPVNSSKISRQVFKQDLYNYLRDEVITSIALHMDYTENGAYGRNLRNYNKNARELRVFSFLQNKEYGKEDTLIITKPEDLEIDAEYRTASTITQFIKDEGSPKLTKSPNRKDLTKLQALTDKYIDYNQQTIDYIFDRYIDNIIEKNRTSLLESNIIIKLGDGSYIVPGVSREVIEDKKYLDITLSTKGIMSADSMNKLLLALTYNYFVGSQEQLKLVIGDVAMYETPVDFHKRLSSIASTRKHLSNDKIVIDKLNTEYQRFDAIEHTDRIKAITVNNISFSSDNKDALKVSNDYKKIKVADGQTWGTLDFIRSVHLREGSWADGQEKTYQWEMQTLAIKILNNPEYKEIYNISESVFTDPNGVFYKHTKGVIPTIPMFNGKELKTKDLKQIPPIKPIGVGVLANNLAVAAIDINKMSVAPIFPLIVNNNDNFKLFLSMLNTGTDIISDINSRKAEAIVNETYNPDTKTISLLTKDSSFTYQYYDDYGLQLEIATEEKLKVTYSSQLVRLNTVDLFSKGEILEIHKSLKDKAEEYTATLSEYYIRNKVKLLNELGFKVDKEGEYFLKHDTPESLAIFKDTLTKMFVQRLMPMNVIEGLDLALDSKEKVFDVLTTGNKIKEVLNALVKNQVIKRKVPGEMYVQESNYLYSESLKFYRVENGKVLAMEVMVPLPENWIPWVESIGGIEELNKRIERGEIDERILTFTANRIPTQHINTMEVVKIKKFLPTYVGQRIILPYEIVVKAGSDFDIDKLTSYLKSVKMTRKGPVYKEFLTEENSTVKQRAKELLKNSNFSDLITLLGTDAAEIIKDYYNEIDKTIQDNYKTKKELEKTEEFQSYIEKIEYYNTLEKQAKNQKERESISIERYNYIAAQRRFLSDINEAIEINTEESVRVEEHVAKAIEDLPILKQNSLDAITNRLNELTISSILDVSRFEDLLRPNETNYLRELAENNYNEVFDVEKMDVANYENITQLWYNLNKAQVFWQSLMGVAQSAVHSVAHATTQQHPITLNSLVNIFLEGVGKNESESLKIGFLTDLENRKISYNIAEFISAFVDAEKDPFVFKLNATTEVFPIIAFLNRVGNKAPAGLDIITKFVGSPIVKEYLLRFKKSYSTFAFHNIYEEKDFHSKFFGHKNEIVTEMLSVWNRSKSEGILPTTYEETLAASVIEYFETPVENRNSSIILKKIKDYNYKPLTSKQIQKPNAAQKIQILDNFLMYQFFGRMLGKLNSVTRPDAEFGKTPQELELKLLSKESLEKTLFFSPYDLNNLINNSFLREPFLAKTEAIEMFKNYSLMQKYPILNNFFKSKFIDKFNSFNIKQRDLEKVLNTASDELLNFLYSYKYKSSSATSTYEAMHSRLKDMFRGEKSIAKRLLEISKIKSVQDNELLIALRPAISEFANNLGRSRDYDYITKFNNRFSVDDINNLVASFDELLESDNKEVREFANDLVEFAFLQNGLSSSYINFMNLVPNTAFVKMMDNVLSSIGYDSTITPFLESFEKQFYKNNSNNSDIVPKISYNLKEKRNYIEVFANSKNGKRDFLKTYWLVDSIETYKQKKKLRARPRKEVLLFEKSYKHGKPEIIQKTNEKGVVKKYYKYNLVKKLGDGMRFKEYYFLAYGNIPIINSVLPSNNYDITTTTSETTNKQVSSEIKSPINFLESKSSDYSDRTRKNASADATIAIANYITESKDTDNKASTGEKLTKKVVREQGKKYIAVPIEEGFPIINDKLVDTIVSKLNSVNAKTLNIAGNGIYTLKGKYTQQQIDKFTYELLKAIIESPKLKTKIESIRTGGQTGFDEAGAKAGSKLGIPTTILAPKGWKFRTLDGDISDKSAFMKRFENYKSFNNTQRELPFSLSSNLFQLEDEGEIKELSEEINNNVIDFLNAIGVKINSVKAITDRFGNEIEGANAVARLTQMTIDLADGKLNLKTLPEEAAHFYVHLLPKDSALYLKMATDIVNYPQYIQVKEKYKDLYTTEQQFIDEAIGKLISDKITGSTDLMSDRLVKQSTTWLSKLIEFIKSFFSKGTTDPYAIAANDILSSNLAKLDLKISPKEENAYQLKQDSIKPGVSELFESNPELANAVYSAMGLNTINESEITYTDEEGKPCAKMGGRGSNFTKGSKWEVVKDLKGYPSHAQGGVDIKLGKDGFSFTRGSGQIMAAHGLVLPAVPVMADYAGDGSLYPEEPVINPNNTIQLKEVTVTAEAPTWLKYKREWEKENPFDIDKYVEDRFNNPVGREAISRINEKGWREQLRQEGLKKRNAELDEATKMGLLYQRFNPQGKDDIAVADEQFSKRYGTSPHRYRYDNDSEYRKYYEQQARNATSKIDLPSTDLRRKDVVAPNSMWMYPNLTGESKAQATNFSNTVIGMALPIPGLDAMGKIPSVFKVGKNLIKGVGVVEDVAKAGSKVLNKTDDVVSQLRQELVEKGIVKSQKTPNLPWKEPIRKGIEPWGYGDVAGHNITGSKFKDVKGAIFDGKNPLYKTEEEWLKEQEHIENVQRLLFKENKEVLESKVFYPIPPQPKITKTKSLKEAIDIRDKGRLITKDGEPLYFDAVSNRYATWDMYLGKPQTKHPLYDISELTTSKNDVIYTIKKDFMNTNRIESRFDEYLDAIKSLEKNGKTRMKMIAADDMYKKGDSWIIPDSDKDMFGTMGGFHWEVNKLPDGNYKIFANDIWDLQPFKGKSGVNTITGKIIDKIAEPIGNIEVGKALGIGKPLNVKVGFIVDGKTKKIINTFGLVPAAIATGAAINSQNNKTE